MKEMDYNGKKIKVEPCQIETQKGGYRELKLDNGDTIIVNILISGVYKEIGTDNYLIQHNIIVDKK